MIISDSKFEKKSFDPKRKLFIVYFQTPHKITQ